MGLSAVGRLSQCARKSSRLAAPGRKRATRLVSGKRVAGGGHVGPGLGDDGIRPLAEQTVEPQACAAVRLRPRDARAEADLGLDIPEGRRTVELADVRSPVAAGGEEQGGEQAVAAHGQDEIPLGKQSQRGHVRAVSDSLPRRARAGTRR